MSFDSKLFLIHYGYLAADYDQDPDPSVMAAAVSHAQEFYGLDPSGKLDGSTVKAFATTPRCGCPDIEQLGAQRPRWGKRHLRYAIEGYVGGMAKGEVDRATKQAFENVSSVCGLTFEQVSVGQPVDILIRTGRGRRAQLDGLGGTLGYAYMPTSSNFFGTLTITLDLDERWSFDFYVAVLTHEGLHTLGVSHTAIANQLMNAFYNSRISVPQGGYDIPELVARYGERSAAPAPAPVPTAPKPSSPAPSIETLEVLLRVNGRDVYAGNLQPQ